MSAWRRSMSSTRKTSEQPNPLYNLPAAAAEAAIEVAEAAEGAEAAFRFGGAAAAEAAGGGAID